MTKQELFEKLSELECRTYYLNDEKPSEEAEQINQLAREILEAYAKMTGCHH